jgi:D-serine deaminase-like pyridoxal phosphate-dependent protein
MRNVTQEATNVLDIWPYVASVPVADLRGHQIYDQFVEYVYRDATGRFDHVLVMTRTKNVYLTVVIDLVHDRIHGHHLLDLNEKYGLSAPAST